MAVVCMVNTTSYELLENITEFTTTDNAKCQRISDTDNYDQGYRGTFLWTSAEISLLLSATWYGSLISLWWSGYLADRFGPKIVLFIGVADCMVITLLTPLFANLNFYLLFGARFIMGIGEGSMGFIWVFFWLLISSNNPEQNKFVSPSELNYLEKELQTQKIIQNETTQQLYQEKIPWLKIFTSIPILMNFIAQWAYNFSLALLQSYLPIYMKQVLHIELSKNGFYAMLPFLSQLITKNMLGILSDWLKKKGILKNTTACKLFQSICNFGSALTYLTLALFVDCTRRNIAIIVLIFHGIFFSSGVCGFFTSHLSLAPQYTGILFSIMRLAATFGSMVSVSLVGFINQHGTEEEWARIWYIAAFCNVVVGIAYIIFGSAEIQPWADKNLSNIKVIEEFELKNATTKAS
uniref:Uncharacterized protein n=1 Tax=Panagrolaimus davidi TaxID=227884 RepID=A0A914QQS7_9BILA